MCYATASQLTWWKAARTCAAFRSCWGTLTSRPRRCTRTWRGAGCGRSSINIIRARETRKRREVEDRNRMSDYIFMLESHLSADQFRVVGQMKELAAQSGVNLFLTGGALRDMLGGFPVRDLDFTARGSSVKLAKTAAHKHDAVILSTDYLR